MTEPTQLKPVDQATGEFHKEAADILRNAADLIEEGEVMAVAITMVRKNQKIRTAWSCPPEIHSAILLGALTCLEDEILSEMRIPK